MAVIEAFILYLRVIITLAFIRSAHSGEAVRDLKCCCVGAAVVILLLLFQLLFSPQI